MSEQDGSWLLTEDDENFTVFAELAELAAQRGGAALVVDDVTAKASLRLFDLPALLGVDAAKAEEMNRIAYYSDDFVSEALTGYPSESSAAMLLKQVGAETTVEQALSRLQRFRELVPTLAEAFKTRTRSVVPVLAGAEFEVVADPYGTVTLILKLDSTTVNVRGAADGHGQVSQSFVARLGKTDVAYLSSVLRDGAETMGLPQ